MTNHIAEILKNDLGVKESYQHAPKWVTPGESIKIKGEVLKWYTRQRRTAATPSCEFSLPLLLRLC